MTHKREFNARSERIEALVGKLDQAGDPELHATAMELVECVMDLHGAGLDRILQMLNEQEFGELAIRRLLEDELVASVLLLHNLHPDDLETRVHRALQQVRPQLESHGCEAELVGLENGIVRVRLNHGGGGCGSTATTMKSAIEDAIGEAAPDAAEVEVEVVQPAPAPQLVTIRPHILQSQEGTMP